MNRIWYFLMRSSKQSSQGRDCTCLRFVDGLGNPTGVWKRDVNCPLHGKAALAAAGDQQDSQ